jgi:hypothetical protein
MGSGDVPSETEKWQRSPRSHDISILRTVGEVDLHEPQDRWGKSGLIPLIIGLSQKGERLAQKDVVSGL